MAALSALLSAAVNRLKITFSRISKKAARSFEKFRKELSGQKNWANYRGNLKAAVPPCVPYLGVHLSDLVFVEQGNSDFLPSPSGNGEVINFAKRLMWATIIQEVEVFQKQPYNLVRFPSVAEFLKAAPVLSEPEMYARSLELEPRQPTGGGDGGNTKDGKKGRKKRSDKKSFLKRNTSTLRADRPSSSRSTQNKDRPMSSLAKSGPTTDSPVSSPQHSPELSRIEEERSGGVWHQASFSLAGRPSGSRIELNPRTNRSDPKKKRMSRMVCESVKKKQQPVLMIQNPNDEDLSGSSDEENEDQQEPHGLPHFVCPGFSEAPCDKPLTLSSADPPSMAFTHNLNCLTFSLKQAKKENIGEETTDQILQSLRGIAYPLRSPSFLEFPADYDDTDRTEEYTLLKKTIQQSLLNLREFCRDPSDHSLLDSSLTTIQESLELYCNLFLSCSDGFLKEKLSKTTRVVVTHLDQFSSHPNQTSTSLRLLLSSVSFSDFVMVLSNVLLSSTATEPTPDTAGEEQQNLMVLAQKLFIELINLRQNSQQTEEEVPGIIRKIKVDLLIPICTILKYQLSSSLEYNNVFDHGFVAILKQNTRFLDQTLQNYRTILSAHDEESLQSVSILCDRFITLISPHYECKGGCSLVNLKNNLERLNPLVEAFPNFFQSQIIAPFVTKPPIEPPSSSLWNTEMTDMCCFLSRAVSLLHVAISTNSLPSFSPKFVNRLKQLVLPSLCSIASSLLTVMNISSVILQEKNQTR